jgi:hypothetical protein
VPPHLNVTKPRLNCLKSQRLNCSKVLLVVGCFVVCVVVGGGDDLMWEVYFKTYSNAVESTEYSPIDRRNVCIMPWGTSELT